MLVKKDTGRIYQVYIPSNELFGDQISLVELTSIEINSLGGTKDIISEKDTKIQRIMNHLKSSGFVKCHPKDELVYLNSLQKLVERKNDNWATRTYRWLLNIFY